MLVIILWTFNRGITYKICINISIVLNIIKRYVLITVIAVQLWKILVAVFSMSWSMVSYQDELRRGIVNKDQLSCGGIITCLIWRATLILARIITIASFAAIKVGLPGKLFRIIISNINLKIKFVNLFNLFFMKQTYFHFYCIQTLFL